jgi:hypothetical protein
MSMDQARSRRRASTARPVRRSLAEFALPANGAPAQMPSAARPVLAAEGALARQQSRRFFATSDQRGKKIINDRLNEEQEPAALSLRPTSRKRAGKPAPTTAMLADAYQTKVLDLMITSAFAMLDYAQRLISAKTPGDFVALSTSQACKQWGLIIKQAGELGSITQRLTISDVERPTIVE